MVEVGDELIASPALVAGVAGPGSLGLRWVGEVGHVARQVATLDRGFERDVQASVDVADALGRQALVEVGRAPVDLAGASVGTAAVAALAVGLEAPVEPVEVFGGQLFESHAADPWGDVALDRLAVVGPGGGLDRQAVEPCPQVLGEALAPPCRVTADALFMADERVSAESVGFPDGAKASLGGASAIAVGTGQQVVGGRGGEFGPVEIIGPG